MTTLHFERNAAENRGVKIDPVMIDSYVCSGSCSCNYGAGYCDQPPSELVKVKSHHQFTLPTGLVFRSFADNYFPCTASNKEAKEWFLKNVRGAFLL